MSQFADRHYRSLLLLIWLIGCALLLFASRNAIADWRMGDPDDQLRMVQVRDWLAGQSWWDITQYRMNPPFGGPMHWSRLVDIPIAAMILLLAPLIGQPGAEQTAAAVVPLLTYGLVLWLYASITKKLFGKNAALLAAASFLLITPAILQLVPMRIDHHGWQLVLFFTMMSALFDKNAPLRAGAIIGLAGALWIEISIEGLPFTAIFIGLLALRWVLPAEVTKASRAEMPFAVALATLAIGTAVLFSITENWSSTPNYCDGLSPVHVFAFATIAAIFCAGLMAARLVGLQFNLIRKLALGAVCMLAGIAVVLLNAPQCAGDAFGTLDPLVREFWFNRTAEGLPIWGVDSSYYAPLAIGLTAGFLGLAYVLICSDQLSQMEKIQLSLLYVASIIVGAFVMRTMVYALCIAAMMLVPVVIAVLTRAQQQQSLGGRMALRIVAVVLLMPSLVGQNLLAQFASTQSTDGAIAGDSFEDKALLCQKPASVAALKQLPTSQLMAALDSSPALLLLTPHSVIATGHHRNQAAMADVIRTFTGSVDQAKRIFDERRVEYLVICEGSFELREYANHAPNGFLAQLKGGSVPDWLSPQPAIGPFQIFKVEDNADSGLALR